MSKRQQRRWLIEAVHARLLPEFVRLGFEVVPSAGDDARGEIRAAFPFGRLRRNGPEGLELVEIQLHKRRAAAFRLNIGIAPPEGVDHFTGQHIAQEDIWVGYLDHFYELYRSPMFRIWFAVRRWSWSKRAVTEGDCGALVDEVIGFLPEVEQALREGRAGPHVRRIG